MGKGKPGFLTPKAIANRIKAKGLQKLRWYCQMCQKQCRDENGFKCHMSSESHQRQLLLFAENPEEHMDSFSKEFESEYLELLRRRFGTKRVNANVVYQEYIAYREHVHMNSTQWETLTDFVKHLGDEELCVVDYTEKGWFVTYIDRNPEAIKRQEMLIAKQKMDVTDEDRTAKFIERQIAYGEGSGSSKDVEYTELQRDNEEEKVTFSLPTSAPKKVEPVHKKPLTTSQENPLSSSRKTDRSKSSSDERGKRKAKTALEEIMEAEEKKKEKLNRKDYWLHAGIIVKVVHKRLGEKYYKKKAVVKEVNDLYTGIIKMIDTGDKLKVDQAHLETVLPGYGKLVMIVNGAYRGEKAVLESIDEKKFSCTVSLKEGLLRGRVIEGVQYEDISKLYQDS